MPILPQKEAQYARTLSILWPLPNLWSRCVPTSQIPLAANLPWAMGRLPLCTMGDHIRDHYRLSCTQHNYQRGELIITRLARIIFSFCLTLGGCTVGLPDGSAIDITYIPPSEEVMDKTKPRINLTTALAGLGASPVAGALLYQYVLRPMRKRREKKQERKDV